MLKKAIIVKTVVFDQNDRILLMRRTETAPRRPLEWDLPGGFVDKDDGSYLDASRRELHEEAGIESVFDSVSLGYAESKIETIYPNDSRDITWLFFTCKAMTTKVTLSYEHDKFTWVSLEHALDLIKYDRQLRALNHLKHSQEVT